MYLKISNNKIENKGFKKINEDLSIFINGYIIWNEKLYWENEFIPIITEHFNKDKLLDYVKEYNGIFYFLIISKNKLQIFIDRYGFLPLMYKACSNSLVISNSSDVFIQNLEWNNNALLDYFSCGFTLGTKTLLKDVYEFKPHTIYTVSLNEPKITINEKNYWKFNLNLNSIKKKNAQHLFKNLLNKKFNIYSNFLRKNGNSILIPISGGLDSRFLLNEFDKRKINSQLITFGSNTQNYDLKRGLELGGYTQHSIGHFIHINNSKLLEKIFNKSAPSNRITTAQPIELFYYGIKKFKEDIPFFISGQSGGFLTGSHMRIKMKQWQKRDDAINYIFNYKTSPFSKRLIAAHKDYLLNEINNVIPEDIDPIEMVYYWELENRQRKFMSRYCLYEGDEHGVKPLMPFYDYDLFDFFTSLQFEELLNQKFFISCLINFVYANNPAFLKVKRGNKPIREINNHYLAEYIPKIENLIYEKFNIKSSKKQFISDDFRWLQNIKERNIPQIIIPYFNQNLGGRQKSALMQIQKILNS